MPHDHGQGQGKGHDKHKLKEKDKNQESVAESEEAWCTDDLDFDADGCLYIHNDALADAIEAKIDAGEFCIRRDDPDYVVVDENGNPIGERPANIQCPC
ncbi:MAG TPA: hypothetical protein VFV24_03620 [Candidatus Eisenbacteria bacterium]|nr:hypothetical protein [Candidatus Eisenbacteria bacterium]